MASLKFFLVASVLIAVAAADLLRSSSPTVHADDGPTRADNGPTPDDDGPNGHRAKKDVLFSTITYPYIQPAVPLVQPAVPLTKTISPIDTLSQVNYIHPYYRTVNPYSYYPYSYYPNNVVYLKK